MNRMFTLLRGLFYYLVSLGYAKHHREQDTKKAPRFFMHT